MKRQHAFLLLEAILAYSLLIITLTYVITAQKFLINSFKQHFTDKIFILSQNKVQNKDIATTISI